MEVEFAEADSLADYAAFKKSQSVVLAGEDSARHYSEALGRRVRYAGDDLAAFANRIAGVVPGWMVYDFVLMYEHLQREGLVATPEELRDAEAIIGHPPRRYREFVRELVT